MIIAHLSIRCVWDWVRLHCLYSAVYGCLNGIPSGETGVGMKGVHNRVTAAQIVVDADFCTT
jgi:hypothetical protein